MARVSLSKASASTALPCCLERARLAQVHWLWRGFLGAWVLGAQCAKCVECSDFMIDIQKLDELSARGRVWVEDRAVINVQPT